MVIKGFRTGARRGCDYRIVQWSGQREVIQVMVGLLLDPRERDCSRRGHQQSYTWLTSVFIKLSGKISVGSLSGPKHFWELAAPQFLIYYICSSCCGLIPRSVVRSSLWVDGTPVFLLSAAPRWLCWIKSATQVNVNCQSWSVLNESCARFSSIRNLLWGGQKKSSVSMFIQ